MMTMPMLEISDNSYNTQYKVHTDANAKALGTVLL